MYGSVEQYPETTAPVHSNIVTALVSFLQPKNYLELGCADGTTFARVMPYCDNATAVDISPLGSYFESRGWRKFVQSDSVEYLKALPDDSLDMVFLDSSHRYEHTINEFVELDRVVRPNGIVAFHDSYPANKDFMQDGNCGRVADAVEVIKRQFQHRWEFCTLPAQFGVTIARKNMGKQLLWRAS